MVLRDRLKDGMLVQAVTGKVGMVVDFAIIWEDGEKDSLIEHNEHDLTCPLKEEISLVKFTYKLPTTPGFNNWRRWIDDDYYIAWKKKTETEVTETERTKLTKRKIR